jgi:hypothetical protein
VTLSAVYDATMNRIMNKQVLLKRRANRLKKSPLKGILVLLAILIALAVVIATRSRSAPARYFALNKSLSPFI